MGFNIFATAMFYYLFRVKQYNPTSVVRGVKRGVMFVLRVFKRRSGKTPEGKEADNGRLY